MPSSFSTSSTFIGIPKSTKKKPKTFDYCPFGNRVPSTNSRSPPSRKTYGICIATKKRPGSQGQTSTPKLHKAGKYINFSFASHPSSRSHSFTRKCNDMEWFLAIVRAKLKKIDKKFGYVSPPKVGKFNEVEHGDPQDNGKGKPFDTEDVSRALKGKGELIELDDVSGEVKGKGKLLKLEDVAHAIKGKGKLSESSDLVPEVTQITVSSRNSNDKCRKFYMEPNMDFVLIYRECAYHLNTKLS